MIKISNITKKYDNKEILTEVEFDIEPGKLTTLLGQNGSGKSTLLRLMSGIEHANNGTILYKDEEVTNFDFSFANDIALIHEGINYIFDESFEEFINRFKENIPRWDSELFYKIIHDRQLDITKNFNEFSRGQKMQLVLTKALAAKTPILLIDEITSVMDIYARKYYLDLLYNYVQEGNTVVITTNIINELEFYTDNLIILKNHKIVLNKPVKQISTNFIKLRKKLDDEEHEIFFSKDCVWAGINSDKSISYIIPEDLAETYNIPQNYIDRRQSSLEDIFIFYFGHARTLDEEAA